MLWEGITPISPCLWCSPYIDTPFPPVIYFPQKAPIPLTSLSLFTCVFFFIDVFHVFAITLYNCLRGLAENHEHATKDTFIYSQRWGAALMIHVAETPRMLIKHHTLAFTDSKGSFASSFNFRSGINLRFLHIHQIIFQLVPVSCH